MQGHNSARLVEYAGSKDNLGKKSFNDFLTKDTSQDNTEAVIIRVMQLYKQHLKELESKFEEEKKKVDLLEEKPENFKEHLLPLARIKKIMKSDEDVKVCQVFYIDDICRGSSSFRESLRVVYQRRDF